MKKIFYSIRIVEANTHEEAERKICRTNDFLETHPMCDTIFTKEELVEALEFEAN